jgi:hypothetical protein
MGHKINTRVIMSMIKNLVMACLSGVTVANIRENFMMIISMDKGKWNGWMVDIIMVNGIMGKWWIWMKQLIPTIIRMSRNNLFQHHNQLNLLSGNPSKLDNTHPKDPSNLNCNLPRSRWSRDKRHPTVDQHGHKMLQLHQVIY